MRGFDPEFKDFVDYILVITDRIWEKRGIDLIRRWYAPDCIVRTPMGVFADVEIVVKGTKDTLHEFPDRRLLGEDVIWAGSDDDPNGYLSSHRIVSPMTHLGDGGFGPASGSSVLARTIADCAAKDNVIYEEWLVRDQGAIALQVGTTPENMAQALVCSELDQGKRPGFFRPEDDITGNYTRPLAETTAAQTYATLYDRIWNQASFSAIGEGYHFATTLEAPCAISCIGHSAIDRWFMSYLTSFPDANLTVEHLIERQDPGYPTRVSMRWSVDATHSGRGRFGEPSGAPIHLMGISQAEIIDGQVTREWILMDEVAIWKQIWAQRLA